VLAPEFHAAARHLAQGNSAVRPPGGGETPSPLVGEGRGEGAQANGHVVGAENEPTKGKDPAALAGESLPRT
jgi:hypothetical protein